MSIKSVNRIITKIKGENYELDDSITINDLIAILSKKSIDYIRGLYKGIGMIGSKKNLFVGKKVNLAHKSHIQIGCGVQIKDYVEINGLSTEGIILGDNASIGKYSIIRGSGSLKKIGKGLKVGINFGCGDFCFFGCTGGITIGDNVILGQNVRFHSSNHNFDRSELPIKEQGINYKGIKIEDDCWIGAGVTILDGVKIGKGCVIAANSVVTKDIESLSIVGGIPAKVINLRFKNNMDKAK